MTERFNRALASVTLASAGQATVDNSFVTGLPPSGPDSLVFAHDGNVLIPNTDAGTIEEINLTTKQVLKPQVNNTPIPGVADLALDATGPNVWAIPYSGAGVWKVSLGDGTTTQYGATTLSGMGGSLFNTTGTRLFASSHSGVIYELSTVLGALFAAAPRLDMHELSTVTANELREELWPPVIDPVHLPSRGGTNEAKQ